MYIVDGDLLTAIGDAIREKGELARVTQLPLVKKSSNCEGPNIKATTPGNASDLFEETFVVNGASSVRVSAYFRPAYETNDGVDNIDNGGLIINGTKYKNYTNDKTYVYDITKIVEGDSVTIKWDVYGYVSPSSDKNLFYYIEVDGLDADGNTMETYNKPLSTGADGLTLAEMAEAIGATVRAPLSEDEVKTLTENGTHDMNGYRWAEVNVVNEAFPTTYKEVVVTSEDNIHFDLSDYILSDNQYFSICFTYQYSVNGTGTKYEYHTGYYHHNPMMRALTNQVFYRTAAETAITVQSGDMPHGGVVTWAEFDTGTLGGAKAAVFENGILSFKYVNGGNSAIVGTSAVLRYVE
jgi:hypothetical protein